ncbi:MAG: threonylcarbamoyl-AMP synthase [Clostridia bacterium]|nr:threonylcarbamoyl-AMP synthase [Clostridia bacterium]
MNTEILKIVGDVTADSAGLRRAANIIKRGGLVVFPTETVYGLGADATNAEAADKIYSAKGRPADNPLIIHVARPEDAEPYAVLGDMYYRLAEAFMPGPLTVILTARDTVPSKTRGGLPTVAVRCPSSKIARELISLSGVPIAAPSANLSGSPSPTSARHVIDDMMGRVDMIIDGGDADIGVESTIVRINPDDTLTLLRPGKITPSELSALGAKVDISDAVLDKLPEGQVAESPGMKYRHYAPKAPVVLLDGDLEKIVKYIINDEKAGHNKAALCYTEDMEELSHRLPEVYLFDLGSRSDALERAHRLFGSLREADKHSFDIIYAPLPEKCGVDLALYNRMIRAAAHKIIKL